MTAEMTMHVPASGEREFKQKEYTILTIRAMSGLLERNFCEEPNLCTLDSDKGFGLISLGEYSCSTGSKVGCVCACQDAQSNPFEYRKK